MWGRLENSIAKIDGKEKTLTIACHGTSFISLADARNYAIRLQKLGLCVTYMVGQYTKEGHIMVYDSKSELLQGEQK